MSWCDDSWSLAKDISPNCGTSFSRSPMKFFIDWYIYVNSSSIPSISRISFGLFLLRYPTLWCSAIITSTILKNDSLFYKVILLNLRVRVKAYSWGICSQIPASSLTLRPRSLLEWLFHSDWRFQLAFCALSFEWLDFSEKDWSRFCTTTWWLTLFLELTTLWLSPSIISYSWLDPSWYSYTSSKARI